MGITVSSQNSTAIPAARMAAGDVQAAAKPAEVPFARTSGLGLNRGIGDPKHKTPHELVREQQRHARKEPQTFAETYQSPQHFTQAELGQRAKEGILREKESAISHLNENAEREEQRQAICSRGQAQHEANLRRWLIEPEHCPVQASEANPPKINLPKGVEILGLSPEPKDVSRARAFGLPEGSRLVQQKTSGSLTVEQYQSPSRQKAEHHFVEPGSTAHSLPTIANAKIISADGASINVEFMVSVEAEVDALCDAVLKLSEQDRYPDRAELERVFANIKRIRPGLRPDDPITARRLQLAEITATNLAKNSGLLPLNPGERRHSIWVPFSVIDRLLPSTQHPQGTVKILSELHGIRKNHFLTTDTMAKDLIFLTDPPTQLFRTSRNAGYTFIRRGNGLVISASEGEIICPSIPQKPSRLTLAARFMWRHKGKLSLGTFGAFAAVFGRRKMLKSRESLVQKNRMLQDQLLKPLNRALNLSDSAWRPVHGSKFELQLSTISDPTIISTSDQDISVSRDNFLTTLNNVLTETTGCVCFFNADDQIFTADFSKVNKTGFNALDIARKIKNQLKPKKPSRASTSSDAPPPRFFSSPSPPKKTSKRVKVAPPPPLPLPTASSSSTEESDALSSSTSSSTSAASSSSSGRFSSVTLASLNQIFHENYGDVWKFEAGHYYIDYRTYAFASLEFAIIRNVFEKSFGAKLESNDEMRSFQLTNPGEFNPVTIAEEIQARFASLAEHQKRETAFLQSLNEFLPSELRWQITGNGENRMLNLEISSETVNYSNLTAPTVGYLAELQGQLGRIFSPDAIKCTASSVTISGVTPELLSLTPERKQYLRDALQSFGDRLKFRFGSPGLPARDELLTLPSHQAELRRVAASASSSSSSSSSRRVGSRPGQTLRLPDLRDPERVNSCQNELQLILTELREIRDQLRRAGIQNGTIEELEKSKASHHELNIMQFNLHYQLLRLFQTLNELEIHQANIFRQFFVHNMRFDSQYIIKLCYLFADIPLEGNIQHAVQDRLAQERPMTDQQTFQDDQLLQIMKGFLSFIQQISFQSGKELTHGNLKEHYQATSAVCMLIICLSEAMNRLSEKSFQQLPLKLRECVLMRNRLSHEITDTDAVISAASNLVSSGKIIEVIRSAGEWREQIKA